ncbi:hypothetical protein [Rathayibacter soli]|uniref:hypothetical protein n=1 Tax=Rathayibacter soli TaxID=3144168 RepID=UPI0027E5B78F|nr:hypothetical protein [Glaciibacter superstes]
MLAPKSLGEATITVNRRAIISSKQFAREAGHGELASDIEQRIAGKLGLGVDEAAGVKGPAGVDAGPLADNTAGDWGCRRDRYGCRGRRGEEPRAAGYDVQARVRVSAHDSLVRELLDTSRHVPYGDPSA